MISSLQSHTYYVVIIFQNTNKLLAMALVRIALHAHDHDGLSFRDGGDLFTTLDPRFSLNRKAAKLGAPEKVIDRHAGQGFLQFILGESLHSTVRLFSQVDQYVDLIAGEYFEEGFYRPSLVANVVNNWHVKQAFCGCFHTYSLTPFASVVNKKICVFHKRIIESHVATAYPRNAPCAKTRNQTSIAGGAGAVHGSGA